METKRENSCFIEIFISKNKDIVSCVARMSRLHASKSAVFERIISFYKKLFTFLSLYFFLEIKLMV
jgi:hypothetical protein